MNNLFGKVFGNKRFEEAIRIWRMEQKTTNCSTMLMADELHIDFDWGYQSYKIENSFGHITELTVVYTRHEYISREGKHYKAGVSKRTVTLDYMTEQYAFAGRLKDAYVSEVVLA